MTTYSFFTIHNTIVITVTLRASFTCQSTVVSSFYIHQSHAQKKKQKKQLVPFFFDKRSPFLCYDAGIMPILNVNIKVTVDTQ